MSRINKKKLKQQSYKKSKKKSRKTLIWTLILVGLMVASGFGIMLSSYSNGMEKKPYGDTMLKKGPQGWILEREAANYVFTYHPEELEGLEMPKGTANMLKTAKFVYITFDPETRHIQAIEEARFAMMDYLSHEFYPIAGIVKEDEQYNLPIIDCVNATTMIPVVKLVVGENTSITQEGDCVVATATPSELRPMAERIIYSILGVMQ